jgi:GTP-binding protein HflX
VRRRIGRLEDSLARIRRGRETRRHRRKKGELAQVAIVGYTNVGKSTLFNRITDSHVTAEDRPFDTLDTTVRKRRLPSGRTVLFSDTVGFLRNLPAGLLEAFAATLDELRDARLLVHVADASAPDSFDRIEQVRALLRELDLAGAPELVVFNKKDRLERPDDFLPLARGFEGEALVISALDGEDTERVVREVDRALGVILEEEAAALRASSFDDEGESGEESEELRALGS